MANTRSKAKKYSKAETKATRIKNAKAKKVKKERKPRHKALKLHKSFKRSYREDYKREFETPGILAHLAETFKTISKNWKMFGLLMLLVIIANVVLVGIMSEETYTQFQNVLDDTSEEIMGGEIGNVAKASLLLISTITTGGLSTSMSEVQTVFAVILFLIIWLVTIFILRHTMAGHKIKLRDALYNSGSPIISTFIVLAYVILDCVPIFIFIVAYSTAIQTDFLATPFYALLFFIFSALMFLISGYLLSSSIIAMIAVTAPGLYPMKAIHTARDLMMGRRIKFIIRILALFLTLIIIWAVVMIPIILFDLWMKTFEWTAGIPFIPIILQIMTVFTAIFATAYFYIYYRWMLDYEEK